VFRYQTGEVVCRGDEILYSSWRGIVESVFKQGTRLAEEHGAQDGGVMLLFFTGGRVLLDTTDDEEDLVFLRRFDDSVRDEFERSGLLCKMCYADGTPLFPGDIIEQSGENGKVYRAHVKAVHAPFEPSSWLEVPQFLRHENRRAPVNKG